ncbi:MAG: hypothetical protein A2785_04125 [Candidatus Chisholmbacteria bacterium RIFCSPHIGHO2_01_FULL_49_18]|uniref:Uncharacterized protein n=2 Tax=Candidatus Chisholmiibacteriota TaxID=1817900 RepID=A0A1G1VP54_9BACT|nr:MAG: hypothetical protein A2785_04125 [Candidatus Chisholmbacteria bacterium RIFCSPHIGHO2_01_FULL_49_18]OGY22512.1 MAG: hypothetical protein A3A65_00790 [Candidatus Chisholmbacteria bacterium RIFCSPLOWO2_01_FULL_49_14]
MDDVSAEKFNRYSPDTRVRPPSERVHRHSRGEKQGHPKNPVAVVRDARLREQHEQHAVREEIEEAFVGDHAVGQSDGRDIHIDSQARREAQRAARGDDGNQDGRGTAPLSGEALRQAKAEARRERTMKFFGRERRKVKL